MKEEIDFEIEERVDRAKSFAHYEKTKNPILINFQDPKNVYENLAAQLGEDLEDKEDVKQALVFAKLLEKNIEIGSEAAQTALDSFIKYLTENSGPTTNIKNILSSIASIFSSRLLDIGQYIENCDFLQFLITNFVTIDPESIGRIIERFIKTRPEDVIPWLLSPECRPSFQDFPSTISFLSLFIKIHSLLPSDFTVLSDELIQDIQKMNEKALLTMNIVLAESNPFKPLIILESIIILITKANLINLDESIFGTIHELVFMINKRKAFKLYSKLNISLNDDFDFIMSCLEDYDHFSNTVDYIKYIHPEELPIPIIELFLHIFDDCSYKSKLNIFLLLEPYSTVIKDPRIMNVTSFFIEDDQLGYLALHSTALIILSLNSSILEQNIEIIFEKEEELESISYKSTIEGFYASVILDFIHSLDSEP